MPRISANLTNVKAMEPVPAGQYRTAITNAEVKTAKGKDSQYIRWELTVKGGEFEGRKLFTNNSLQENALWNLKAFVETIGLSYDDSGFSTEEALGKEIVVVVTQEPFEGRVVNQIVDFLKAQ